METKERINRCIADQFGISQADIKPGSLIVGDFGADSLDAVELIMALEDEFETFISDEAAEKIQTVGDIYNFFEGE